MWLVPSVTHRAEDLLTAHCSHLMKNVYFSIVTSHWLKSYQICRFVDCCLYWSLCLHGLQSFRHHLCLLWSLVSHFDLYHDHHLLPLGAEPWHLTLCGSRFTCVTGWSAQIREELCYPVLVSFPLIATSRLLPAISSPAFLTDILCLSRRLHCTILSPNLLSSRSNGPIARWTWSQYCFQRDEGKSVRR